MNRKERRQSRAQGRRAAGAAQPRGGAPGSGEVAALFAQAGAALQAGRLQQAETLFRRVLQLDPNHADAHNWLGVVCQQMGGHSEAVEHLRMAVALRPGSADFANNLGIAELALGDLDAARHSLEKALKLNPKLAQAHHNLGLAFQKRREFEPAIACFRQAIALVPDYMNARLNLGNVLSDSGKYDEAIAQFRKLVEIAPQSREGHFNLARALKTAQRFDEAAAEARKVVALDPRNIEARNLLSWCLLKLERYEEAEAETRQALSLDPRSVEAHDRLGTILTTLGRFDEAVESYEAALAVRPNDPAALYGLTNASKTYSTAAMADRIEALLTAGPAQEQKSLLHFSLGKIYDDLDDCERAFESYRRGNELAVPETSFDANIWAEYVDRMIAAFTPAFFETRKSFASSSRRPVFIFGMPRSGTTLTEQIIASHPDVAAGGELETMGDLSRDLPERLGTAARFPECVVDMDESAAAAVAKDYLAVLEKIDAAASRVTDKMPQNFQILGLMALLFPQATFIHCRRDPLDTCLSCYFTKFDRHLEFSYSLENLGAYYRGYRRLTAHWRKVLPAKMLEIDYEDMIADQEGVSRRLIAHCGLEWDDRCLAFHKTDRAVTTASAWQVRQPIYKASLKRWQRYERFLAPLRAALETSD